MKSFHQSAQLPTKGETGVWYQDPRFWVLIFASLLFIGTILAENAQPSLLVP